MKTLIATTNNGINIPISNHALCRLKERNNWNTKTVIRLLPRIYDEGLRPRQIKGHLKDWIVEKADEYPDIEYVLYGNSLYLFDKESHVLITVYRAPNRESRSRVWNNANKAEYYTDNELNHLAKKRGKYTRFSIYNATEEASIMDAAFIG